METWCFLGILFSIPHNKADVYLCAASKVTSANNSQNNLRNYDVGCYARGVAIIAY